jgi:threonine dehydratase
MSTSTIHAPIDSANIRRTLDVIRPYVRQTPVITVPGSDFGLGDFSLTIKLELMQHAGCFKARGAFANLLMRHVPPAGVVAASGGNHGAAVAYAARRLGIPARIFVPTIASPAKVAKIRDYGADLSIVGDLYDDALAASIGWAGQSGALQVHAFDQAETLLGQGTLGAELSEQVPGLQTVLVGVGGGGLIGGVSSWFAGKTRVIGVEPEGAPTLTEAMRAGRPVDAPAGSVAADSLAPLRVGELMFPIAQAYVDRVICVTDDEIVRAQATLWQSLRVMAEPGGSAAFAAVLSGRYVPQRDERVAIVVSGGNTSPGGQFVVS